jgi:hypothetical protein
VAGLIVQTVESQNGNWGLRHGWYDVNIKSIEVIDDHTSDGG